MLWYFPRFSQLPLCWNRSLNDIKMLKEKKEKASCKLEHNTVQHGNRPFSPQCLRRTWCQDKLITFVYTWSISLYSMHIHVPILKPFQHHYHDCLHYHPWHSIPHLHHSLCKQLAQAISFNLCPTHQSLTFPPLVKGSDPLPCVTEFYILVSDLPSSSAFPNYYIFFFNSCAIQAENAR